MKLEKKHWFGIGFGIFYRNAAVGTMIGLGVGFILFGVIKAFMKE